MATGEPPGVWRAAETTLALLITTYADPSRLGGTKPLADGRSRQHPAVTAAAQAFGRTEDAVVFNVMNLRSVLTGGACGFHATARLDHAIVDRYATHLDELMAACFAIVGELPGTIPVMDDLVTPSARRAAAETPPPDGLGDVTTDRIAERVERVGQGPSRTRVLANFAYACAFCGLRSRVPEENSYLLLASHIRPWAGSTGHQRIDPANGLALCAIHDRAFDWGFLGVDEALRIVAARAALDHYEPESRVQAEILASLGSAFARRRAIPCRRGPTTSPSTKNRSLTGASAAAGWGREARGTAERQDVARTG